MMSLMSHGNGLPVVRYTADSPTSSFAMWQDCGDGRGARSVWHSATHGLHAWHMPWRGWQQTDVLHGSDGNSNSAAVRRCVTVL
jgi:hypothetical protein